MKLKFEDIFKELNDIELMSIYAIWLKELKERNLIRTNNVIGELGESLAIKIYNSTKDLPRLQAAPIGTQNIDAISVEGKRYSIKSTTGRVTGAFYGLLEPGSTESESIKFEYVIVVVFSKEFEIKYFLEVEWSVFLKYRKWHSRVRAWNLPITKGLIAESNVIVMDSII
ncbi:hypothetical protein [Planomicrobium okeanokoites]|uniref:Uncharacterized protein n=1 Tax=Planomicrobium okeanokoites TaxID=244 RepID=A0ABV7KRT4_PLAOK|nr:hypothetical protein [Planomicrobium okeanokoites]TAA70027.1 hypothetical protein D2910_06105 [Planomicrobium okeanokoites]